MKYSSLRWRRPASDFDHDILVGFGSGESEATWLARQEVHALGLMEIQVADGEGKVRGVAGALHRLEQVEAIEEEGADTDTEPKPSADRKYIQLVVR